MITPRRLVTLAAFLTAYAILAAVHHAASPPDPGGGGHDSFGVKPHGLRGLLETMEALGVPASRSFLPPHLLFRAEPNATLALLSPDGWWLRLDARTLERTAHSLRRGGRLVVALPHDWLAAERLANLGKDPFGEELDWGEEDEAKDAPAQENDARDNESRENETRENETRTNKTRTNATRDMEDSLRETVLLIPDELGLPGLNATMLALAEPEPGAEEDALYPYSRGARLAVPAWRWDGRLARGWTLDVAGEGSLVPLADLARSLRVPGPYLQTIGIDAANASSQNATLAGLLRVKAPDGRWHVILAHYRLGQGECLVLSDSGLLVNALLDQADNAALAAWCLAPAPGARLHLDEFFNGLSVRGNPFWLLGRAPYGQLALMLALGALLAAWRVGVRLGPVLEPPPMNRRTVEEYVDAMASLFFRGACHRFIMARTRSGALWVLRRRLRLGLAKETPEAVVAAMARRDPPRAQALQRALAHCQALADGTISITTRGMLDAARELFACL